MLKPLLLVCLITPLSGVIFYEAANPPANTETAPTGVYADSGWQHQIVLKREAADNLFFGTIISPKHFVTARHLSTGSASSDARIVVRQPSYITGGAERVYTFRNATTPIPIQYVDGGATLNTDLYIYEIWETFPDYAELYSSSDEAGKEAVMTGYGDSRGSEITTADGRRGWGPNVGLRRGRWGTNLVEGFANGSQLLRADFDAQDAVDDPLDSLDANATTHECQLANKDSGGAWFIKDGATWKLAGINFAVDTYGSTPTGSTGNRWAIHDGVGLYRRNPTFDPDAVPAQSPTILIEACFLEGIPSPPFQQVVCDPLRRSHSYATRISNHIPAINAVIQPAKDLVALSAEGKFGEWAVSYGLTAVVARDADSDSDGLTNLEEYLTESDPDSNGSRTLPLVVDSPSAGVHRFTVVESLDLAGRGLTTLLQQSSDLSSWVTVTGQIETSNTLDSIKGVRTRVLTQTPASSGVIYYRLKVDLD